MNKFLPSWFPQNQPLQIEKKNISSLAPKILTDTKEVAKIKPYLDSLKKTIDANGITNIAIAGSYGSGKSTIIKTFQHFNPQHEYLNISLASFNDVDGVKKDELERLLEISILQQIFYHVKPSEIPDSRFKRIINITDKKIFSIATCLIVWVFSTILLFKFNYIENINPSKWNLSLSFDWVTFLCTIAFFAGLGLFAKAFTRLFSNSKINKFNIKGELELGDNLDKSVFNEHLEEIIYFFERTSYNVIVIEDLDRFKSTDIFTKLREINILLNSSKLINREINFVYAIKDEMFKDKSVRVKFFEYIIPVIPFINPSTAGEQLSKMISEANLVNVLSSEFTEDVVTFIDDIDMRLLINIFHEYQLYKQNLIDDISQDCLFAIITYKNLFPDDFGELQKKKGKLYDFLCKKNEYIEGLIQKIDEEIKEIEISIENIEDETIDNLEELRAIYINALQVKLPDAVAINLGTKVMFSELNKEENFEKLLDSNKFNYSYYQVYNSTYHRELSSTSNISFADVENEVNQDFTFEDRREFILSKSSKKTDNYKAEIQKLKNKKIEIESWSLQRIFEEIDINKHLINFTDNGLIKNLLLNGYINENYNDYISIFHEVNLTKEDFLFERKVKSGESTSFDYKLTKIENLVRKLPEKYFKRDTILNFDLMDFLAENYTQYQDEYDSIIGVLSNEKEKSIEFIDKYSSQREKNIGLFFQKLCSSWTGIWDFIILKSKYTGEKVENYMVNILKYSDINDIASDMMRDNISGYINNRPDFLSIIEDENYNDKLKEIFKELDIKFESLENSNDKTKDLFNYVYENNLYKLNSNNISLMLQEKGNNIKLDSINKLNCTTILSSNCQPIKDYIENNVNEYLKNVFLKLPENDSESEKTMIDLLNNEKVYDDLKFDIIEKQNLRIEEISSINDVYVQSHILFADKLVANWTNILKYFKNNGEKIDEALTSYLNEKFNYEKLARISFSKNKDINEEDINTFSLKLIYNNNLTLESYSSLVKKITTKWSSINIEKLDFNKVAWMVQQKKVLALSVDNYHLLKEHFTNLHVTFLVKSQVKFIKDTSDYELDDNTIVGLLSSSEFTTENKILIIQEIDDEKIINSKEISKLACSLLSTTHHISLNYPVLESLIKNSNSLESRIKLINKHIDTISELEIQTLVESLGYNFREMFKKQHKPKLPNFKYIVELVAHLSRKTMIKRFEIDKNDTDKIRVYANY